MIDKNKHNERQKRYQHTKDRINFVMEKGTKERIQTASDALNISCAEFIRRAIEEKLQGIEEKPRDD